MSYLHLLAACPDLAAYADSPAGLCAFREAYTKWKVEADQLLKSFQEAGHMVATLRLTPESNVDETNLMVIDHENILLRDFVWIDVVTVVDLSQNRKVVAIPVSAVSLFNHRLVWHGETWRILHMFSQLSKPQP